MKISTDHLGHKMTAIGRTFVLVLLLTSTFCSAEVQADTTSNAKTTPAGSAQGTSQKTASVKKSAAKIAGTKAASNSRAPASVPVNAKNQSKVAGGSLAQGPARGPSSLSDSDRALEIRGQSRNLSMMLTLKNRHENIDFVKPRESYKEEIQNTGF